MKKGKQIVSYLLVFILCSSLFTPSFSLQATENTLYISTAKELLAFAKACTLDSWSKDKQVVLKADIDLSETDFTPIPIFSGTFDGAGYTLRGLKVEANGSYQGLFRYVEAGALIQNLHLEATIVPGGSKDAIGGIAGSNKGTLKNCTFSGTVSGNKYIGGIAGINESSGIILECTGSGTLSGKSMVGGITGENRGTIIRSINHSSINTKVLPEKTQLGKLATDGLTALETSPELTDTGGISGVNIGIIQNCTNQGPIGYEHVGYNIGGIAGRQSGYITDSTNTAPLYGRKEVGGIVGQMEPYTTLTYSESKLQQLGKELDILQAKVHTALDHADNSSDAITKQLTTISNSAQAAQTQAESLLGQTQNIVDENINTLNEVSLTVAQALDYFVPISNQLTEVSLSLEEALLPLEESLHSLIDASESTDDGLVELKALVKHLPDILDDLDETFLELNNGMNFVRDAMNSLSRGEFRKSIDYMRKAVRALNDSSYALHDTLTGIKETTPHLEDLLKASQAMNTSLGDALKAAEQSVTSIENGASHLTESLLAFSELTDYLASQPEVSFTTGDETFEETKNNLSGALSQTAQSVTQLNEVINTETHILLNDFSAITDQLFAVLNTLLDVTESVTTFDPTGQNLREDISDHDTQEQTQGKVANCQNTGAITGDINVGGIAGAITIERSFDPEDDLKVIGDKSLNFIFQTRAIIRNCQNKGNITGKKDGVGGIVGSMKLGYIVNTQSEGKITSQNGNYVGGIAGQSHSLIRSSAAKCTLEGGKYIGGIVGEGKDLVDCRSYSTIVAANEYTGAIAGHLVENGSFKNNFFVKDSLGGIDGISYLGKAEPLAYEDFIKLEGIPELFLHFNLSFIADEMLVDTLPFRYGEKLDPAKLPLIPQKEGYSSDWESFDTASLTFDQTIEAIYSPFIYTLESSQRKEGTMPLLLAEGKFKSGDVLTLSKSQHTPLKSMNDEAKELEQWTISLPLQDTQTYTLRYLLPSEAKNVELYRLEGETWTKVPFKQEGPYAVFEVTEPTTTFSSIRVPKSLSLKWSLLALILLFLALLIKRFKKKNARKQVEVSL